MRLLVLAYDWSKISVVHRNLQLFTELPDFLRVEFRVVDILALKGELTDIRHSKLIDLNLRRRRNH